jgi:glycerate-2-kinase
MNCRALEAMRITAEILGYHARVRDTAMMGVAREKGRELATIGLSPYTSLLYGGETTARVSGNGEGDGIRNLPLPR